LERDYVALTKSTVNKRLLVQVTNGKPHWASMGCTVGTRIVRSFNFDILLDLDHSARPKCKNCDLTAAYASDRMSTALR